MKKVTSRFPLFVSGMLMLGLVTINSCDDNDDDPPLPPIGGYNTSDEVASANSVAKWSFESSLTETKANLTGTSTNTAFIAGKKGMAFEGSSTQARYAIYEPSPGIQSATSLTVAFWMKAPQSVPSDTVPVQGKGVQGIFALNNPADFWGGINLFVETNQTSAGVPNPDTLRVKLFWQNKRAGVVWQGQDPIFSVPAAVDQWVHVTFTYDASNSVITVYKNGAKGGAKSLSGPYGPYDGSNTLYASDPGGAANPSAAPLHGALQFPTATKMVIGSNQFSTNPTLGSAGAQSWATTFRGLLDEFRIYNKALSSSEVESLYQLEDAGR